MAGDWIPMRTDLWTCPEVVRILSGVCPDSVRSLSESVRKKSEIVGAMFRTWSLFDTHTTDGILIGYTPELLDSEVGIPNWSANLQHVGWLVIEPQALVMPGFATWLSASAKARLKDAQRKRVERMGASDSCPNSVRKSADKNRTTEQNRRDKKERKKERDLSEGMEFVVERVPELANGNSLWHIAADPSGMVDGLGAITPETVQTSRNVADWFAKQSTATRPAIEPTARGLCVALAVGMAARDRARDRPAGLFATIVKSRKWADVVEYLPRAVAEVRGMIDAGTVRLVKGDDHG